MRNRFNHLAPVFGYVGTLLMVFSAIMLLPVIVLVFTAGGAVRETSADAYLVPALICLVIGSILNFTFRKGSLSASQSMLVCALGWLAVSAVGAMPFWMSRLGPVIVEARVGSVLDPFHISYLDAYFEAMAGFTTTGITMFQGLDFFPPSLLFWRSLTQWLGGLGILSFFILVLFSAGSAHTLYGAEGHKVFSKRPRPGIFNTVKILWLIYVSFTVVLAVALHISGVPLFDSLNLAFTSVSTGGFAPYDESIGYFASHVSEFPHYRAIEYIIIAGMLAGGISFVVHYRLLRGRINALWNTGEIRLWWAIVAGGTALVAFDVMRHTGVTSAAEFEEKFRACLFQAVAVLTTTGFRTKDISAQGYFFGISKQVLLLLMIVGGCVGSTSGGIKVFRIQLLAKALAAEVGQAVRPRWAVRVLRTDGELVHAGEVRRTAGLFFAWLALIAAGGIVTAAFSTHTAYESISGMVSAVSNIGPCYISAADLIRLHPVVKVTYILGMLAGRLEILPVLLLFNRRAWT
ncbi:MAG: TrkH family potassium uptake protein [Planctomycetes bacterium]|nr:TrkH family potassium uptake protein [Planctomycetota bacterium]